MKGYPKIRSQYNSHTHEWREWATCWCPECNWPYNVTLGRDVYAVEDIEAELCRCENLPYAVCYNCSDAVREKELERITNLVYESFEEAIR